MPHTTAPSPKWGLVLLSICLLVFLLNIDYTAANLALLPISKDVNADLNNLQWLLSGYVLVWGALVVPAGRLADLYGKRRVLMIGIGVFLIGSWVTGAGSSIEILIFGRVLQGIGAAIFSPPCYGIIFSLVPAEKQGVAMGAFAAASGFGLAAGPTLAGLILDMMNWRWIFYVNLPIGILVIVSILKLVPKDPPAGGSDRIDGLCALFLTLGLSGVMVALNQIEVWGWSPKLWLTMGVGAAFLLAFYHRNKNAHAQTIPLDLFQNRPLMSVIYAMFLSAFNFSLVLVMMGLFIQKIMGYSSYKAGLTFLSMTLAVGILSPIGGRFADRMDSRIPIMFGFVSLAIGTGCMSVFSVDTSMPFLVFSLFLTGLGFGFSFPALNAAMLKCAPAQNINTASGVFTMASMLGNTISVILSTSFLVIFGRQCVIAAIGDGNGVFSIGQEKNLLGLVATLHQQTIADNSHAVSHAMTSLLNDAFVYGLSWNMRIGAVLAFLAAVIIFFRLRDVPKPAAL